MRCSLVLPLLVLVPRLAGAGPKLTLDDTIGKALDSPKAHMADADRDAAAAKVDEADAAWYPRLKLTAFGTASPHITCDATVPNCVVTDPNNFTGTGAFQFSGLFVSAQLDVTQPIYTFGKIGHAKAAARAGLDAERALADEAAGDLAIDAARAYWGVKVARELVGMLDDGIDQINGAVEQLNSDPKTTIVDRQRIAVLLTEAKAQRAEASQQEQAALAGLRAITGIPDADIDDAVLQPVERKLPEAGAVAVSSTARPQTRAAIAGAAAADELADLEHSQYFPDVAIVASGVAAKAQGVDVPVSAFANNPYNRLGAGAVLGLQWTIEPWNVHAREAHARAEAHKAHAQADLARVGARYDVETAIAEAAGARDKLAARDQGQQAARTWLAAVLQNQAIGTAEPRDLADAYVAWFQNRALWGQAVFQWNTAIVQLDRAAGEFHAGGYRPR